MKNERRRDGERGDLQWSGQVFQGEKWQGMMRDRC